MTSTFFEKTKNEQEEIVRDIFENEDFFQEFFWDRKGFDYIELNQMNSIFHKKFPLEKDITFHEAEIFLGNNLEDHYESDREVHMIEVRNGNTGEVIPFKIFVDLECPGDGNTVVCRQKRELVTKTYFSYEDDILS